MVSLLPLENDNICVYVVYVYIYIYILSITYCGYRTYIISYHQKNIMYGCIYIMYVYVYIAYACIMSDVYTVCHIYIYIYIYVCVCMHTYHMYIYILFQQFLAHIPGPNIFHAKIAGKFQGIAKTPFR